MRTGGTLTNVGKYDNKRPMHRKAQRNISWIKAADKDFRAFPIGARQKSIRALTQIAEGDAPEVAKPLTGLGTGVWE
jgi:phage-related protein